MNSMTGYGKGVVSKDGKTLTIELKSVNNRFMEINSRLPKALSSCEDIIRREIQSSVKRGAVDVYFNYDNFSDDSKTITVDMPLARSYIETAKKLRTEFMLENDFQTTALLRSTEVLKIEYTKDEPEILEQLVKECIKIATNQLNVMREIEGRTIRSDLYELTGCLVDNLKEIIKRVPKVLEEQRKKLELRIKDALQSVEIDQAKLLNEVAFFADKSDINEEVSRLSSHINQFVSCLESGEPQGRKLDFLSQEINREINTMGSKSNDIELTNIVITMKNALEKIKEQIRNVE